MNNIEDLISRLCANGVPHRRLGEIGEFTRGRRFTKADRVDDGLPSIHYGEIYTHYGVSAAEALSHVNPELGSALRFATKGDVVFAAVGETVEDVGKAVAWLGDRDVAVHDDCFIFRSDLDAKFVAYFTQSAAFNRPKEPLVARAKVKRLSSESLGSLRIPVPPLEVQREIVRILDRLAALESALRADLEAELEARREQDGYYRARLLSFPGGVEWVPMGDILREPLANGRSAPDGEGYPVLRLTALRTQVIDPSERKAGNWTAEEGSRFRIEAGDIFASRASGSRDLIGRASIAETTEEVAFPDTMIRIRPDLAKVSPRYFLHAWADQTVRASIQQKAKAGTGAWKVSQGDLATVRVPIPPLDEQARLAGLLDAFDSQMSELVALLRAEITARRKQYMHYRDRLLTFDEAAS